jgi:hypothetical protein
MTSATRAGTVTRAEWRWVLAAALLVLACAQAPYLYAWTRSGPDMLFSGFLLNVYDNHTYLSKMQQGAHGAWLFQVAHTTEPHSGTLLFQFYLLLGRLAAALGLPLVAAYDAAWWAASLAMLAVTYRFIALFLRARWMRRLAWLLVAACSGLSWALLAPAGGQWLNGEPLDIYSPEGFASLSLIYMIPHLALARACILGGLIVLIGALERGRTAPGMGSERAGALLAGLLWLAAALLVPLYVFVAGAVTAACLAALAARRRALPWRELRLALLAGAPLVPFGLYVWWIFRSDAVLAAWSRQSNIYSPAPIYYLAAYGLLIVLAVPAARWAWRAERRLWLLGWVLVVPLLVYLPFNFQRRLAEGFQVALAVLAVAGLAHLGATWLRTRARARRLARAGLLGLLLPGNLLLLVVALGAGAGQAPPAFHPRGLVAVAGWLEREAPRANVLASYESGNVLPALAYVHVYTGYDPETPDVAAKNAAVARFYAAGTPDAERRALLAAGRIDAVVLGAYERALAPGGVFDAAHAPYLREVFREGEWAIYAVVK